MSIGYIRKVCGHLGDNQIEPCINWTILRSTVRATLQCPQRHLANRHAMRVSGSDSYARCCSCYLSGSIAPRLNNGEATVPLPDPTPGASLRASSASLGTFDPSICLYIYLLWKIVQNRCGMHSTEVQEPCNKKFYIMEIKLTFECTMPDFMVCRRRSGNSCKIRTCC